MPDLTAIADEHARLLSSISNLDSAPTSLVDATALLTALNNDLDERTKKLDTLRDYRKTASKGLDSLSHSPVKRLYVRLAKGGKDALKVRLEEGELKYMEAAQREHNEGIALEEVKEAIREAQARKRDLESQVAQRKQLVQELDHLYRSAFSGPNTEFPEEDAAEDALREAETHFEQVQSQLNREQLVYDALGRAAVCAGHVVVSLKSASRNATFDTLGIANLWSEMAERDDLFRAQTVASQAHRHYQRARQLDSRVPDIRPADVVSAEWLNVVFDNLYTDYLFQQKVDRSLSSSINYQAAINAEKSASEARLNSLHPTLRDASSFLRSRRRELAAVRRDILVRIKEDIAEGIRHGDVSEELPKYGEQQGELVLTIEQESSSLISNGENSDTNGEHLERGRSISSAPPPSYSVASASRSPHRIDSLVRSTSTSDSIQSSDLTSDSTGPSWTPPDHIPITPPAEIRYAPPPGPPPPAPPPSLSSSPVTSRSISQSSTLSSTYSVSGTRSLVSSRSPSRTPSRTPGHSRTVSESSYTRQGSDLNIHQGNSSSTVLASTSLSAGLSYLLPRSRSRSPSPLASPTNFERDSNALPSPPASRSGSATALPTSSRSENNNSTSNQFTPPLSPPPLHSSMSQTSLNRSATDLTPSSQTPSTPMENGQNMTLGSRNPYLRITTDSRTSQV